MSLSVSWYTPVDPIADLPSPALFIGRKKPAFSGFPEYLKTSEIEWRRPPWDPA
jgi:hypothetical protein